MITRDVGAADYVLSRLSDGRSIYRRSSHVASFETIDTIHSKRFDLLMFSEGMDSSLSAFSRADDSDQRKAGSDHEDPESYVEADGLDDAFAVLGNSSIR